jgi:CDP-diacylglycerol--glycerol-3-phosphate 3-phosphatidyltransferase
MGLADQLTLARVAAVPLVVALYVSDFRGHDWWATGLFIAAMTTDWFDGRVARSRGRSSPLGSLLDPVADKLLVLTVLIVLVGRGVFPGWMVAAIVAREFLVSGLAWLRSSAASSCMRVTSASSRRGRRRRRPRSEASQRPARGTSTSPGGRCSSHSC